MSTITLFTPGPTHIPDSVFAAMARGNEHHRTSEFRSVFLETAELLREPFNSQTQPLFLSCSGSGAMEAAILNCMSPGDVLGFLDAGKFGERWGEIAAAYKIASTPLKCEWGKSPSISDVKNFFSQNPSITHFALQYCETSTAILHDAPAIIHFIRSTYPDVFIILDAISAATTLPIDLSVLKVDALVLASQKAFMLPPGLSMIFCSERYWERADAIQTPSLYFDLTIERKSQIKGDSAWTPTLHLILGLQHVLQLFQKEGWTNVYERHFQCSEFCHAEFERLGIPAVTNSHRPTSLSGGFSPVSYEDADVLRSKMYRSSGIRIAGGQDAWKGKVLRVGHMGIISPTDLKQCFIALEEAMRK
ncbi:MAG: alanine--glyoxylate aminotransferase family protein [Bdellovibrionales bacterium]|nr:alanine--glyoxylate aminotransferase family protein [Bdellovibrionales bacterium]